MEEINLIEFLVAQVAMLGRSSCCVELFSDGGGGMQYYHCRVADSSFGSMRGRGSSIQHCHLVCHPPVVVDALVIVIGLLTSPAVALELQATGVVESFEVKLPDFAALEVGLKGAALVCSRRSAQLAPKCHEGPSSFWFLVTALPSKVVLRQRMAHPRSCSLCPGLHFTVASPLGHFGVSGGFLQSAWCKDVDALHDGVRCHK
jgi:hypothetical protein